MSSKKYLMTYFGPADISFFVIIRNSPCAEEPTEPKTKVPG